jgi:hypothetical protein
MPYFVIAFKLKSEENIFLKSYFLLTLLKNLWQSMASVSMFKYRLKSKDLLPYLKIMYGAIYGNLE